MICAGIDAGIANAEDRAGRRRSFRAAGRGRGRSGHRSGPPRAGLLEKLLREQGLRREDVRAVVATGYGRKLVRTADTTITEITCQARGVRH